MNLFSLTRLTTATRFAPEDSANWVDSAWREPAANGTYATGGGVTLAYPSSGWNDTGINVEVTHGQSLNRPHIDLRLAGTTSGGPYLYVGMTDNWRIPAVSGNVVELSFYAALMAGAPDIFPFYQWYIDEWDSGAGYLTSVNENDTLRLGTPHAPAQNLRRMSPGHASCAYVSFGWVVQLSISTSIDTTIRLLRPYIRRIS